MRLKQGIVALLSLMDLKLKAWSWPKPPPMKFAGTGVVNPIRLHPIKDVVVAGQKNHLPGRTAPRFGESGGAHAGNLSVHHRTELVDDGHARRFTNEPGQVRPELLPVG
ncbi:hypothetical protein D3C81_1421730 [compost metagenome]